MINFAAWTCFYGYTGMLLAVGGSGIFIAGWELKRIFRVGLDAMASVDRSTLLNQYRFLKSLELTFGIWSITFRDEILRPSPQNGVFVTGVFLGVLARTLSIVIDGRCRWVFVVFLVLELVTGIAVLYHARTLGVNP
jgi:hypothetical protein